MLAIILIPIIVTPEKLASIRNDIEKRIHEIEKALHQDDEDTKPVSPDVSIGRLSRLDSMQQQQMALAQQRRMQEEGERLRNALKRMDDGNYGICALCRQPIQEARLEAMPDTVVCVNCAR